MGILGMWTADLQDTLLPGLTFDPAAIISSDYARTGTYSFRNYTNDNCYWQFPTNPETLYFRVAMLFSQVFAGNEIYWSFLNAVYGANATVSILSSVLNVSTGGTLRDTIPVTINVDIWYLLEVYLYVDQTVGECTVKWNDDIVYAGTNIDTQNNASYKSTSQLFMNGPSGIYVYLDDIMARDDQWCGPGGLYVLTPSGGTATENWTASAGNPEDCVDELPASFTDYVYTNGSTPDTAHLFELTDLPITAQSVGGVGVFANVKSVDATSAKVRTLVYSGTTEAVGSGNLLQPTDSWISTYYDKNPDDAAAWEQADIDAIQIGIETTT